MKRRFAIFGLVLLLVGGALLLFGHQWTATTTEPTPVAEKPATRQLVEPPAARAEPPPVEAATPSTPTARLHQHRPALSADASSTR